MQKSSKNKDQKRMTLASLMAGRSTPAMASMYSAIDPSHLKAYLASNSMPAHAFSDRATGIAYRPEVSGLVPKKDMLFNSPETTGEGFSGPAHNRYPKLAKTPLEFKHFDSDGRKGEYISETNRRTGAKRGRMNLSLSLVNEGGNKLIETIGHETQHDLNDKLDARAKTVADHLMEPTENVDRPTYRNYRNTPEEYVAFKAGEMAQETDAGKIAKHFNEDRHISWGNGDHEVMRPTDASTGYNPKYSQTDPTDGFHRRTINESRSTFSDGRPFPPEPPVRSLSKLSRIGGKLGAVANASQLFHIKEAYQAAKKAGASPLNSFLSQMGLAPITERLKDGGIYNHGTGEITYDKGMEPI